MVLVVALWARAASALAQPGLAELQQAANERSFDSQEARALAVQREREAQQAWHGLLPVLSALGSYQHNQYEAVARLPAMAGGEAQSYVITARNQWDLTLSARLPVIDVARWRAVRAARLQAQAEHAQLASTRADVSMAVAQTYYQLLGAEAVLQAARRKVQAAEQNVRYVQTKHEAGSSSELDLQRARAEVLVGQQAVAEAEYSQVTLARALETLTGVALLPPYATLPPDDLHEERPLPSWLGSADATPFVLAAERRAAAEHASAARQRARLLPSLEVKGLERFTNAPGFGESPYYSATVNANWELDFATVAGARAATAAAEVTRVRAAESLAARRDDIHDAWHRVSSLISKCRAARAQFEVSSLAAEIARQEYDAGTTVLLTWIQAKRDAFTAEVAALQADADLRAARHDLHVLAGGKPDGAQP